MLTILIVVLSMPASVSAQSLEWLAEHPTSTGSTSSPQASSVQAASTLPAPANTNDGLEQKVRAYFADAPIMAEIARCESRFRQFDESGRALDGGAGSMMGIFQINAPVHGEFARSLSMDIDTVEGNVAYARYLYQKEGTDPWLSSFSCWHSASPDNAPANTLSQDLILGTISPEVRALQIMLNAKGFILAAEGPGSPGQETEKFGLLTRAAVRKFQCERMQICSGDEHGTGYGMVGVTTRAAIFGDSSIFANSAPLPPPDNSEEIALLQTLIAELSAQLFALKQKS